MEVDSTEFEMKEDGDSTTMLSNKVLFLLGLETTEFVNLKHSLDNNSDFIHQIKTTKDDNSDLIFYYLTIILDYIRTSNYVTNKMIGSDWIDEQLFQLISFSHLNSNYPILKCDNRKNKDSEQKLKLFWSLKYLFDCFIRCDKYRNDTTKDKIISSNILNEIEYQLYEHIILIDKQTLLLSSPSSSSLLMSDSSNNYNCPRSYSNLISFVTLWDTYGRYINNLFAHICRKYELTNYDNNAYSMEPTICPILLSLYHIIRHHTIDHPNYECCLRILYQLLSFKINNGPVKYPIALIVSRLPNWSIEFITEATGKELENLSFLGPFLSGSVFAEDNSSIVAKLSKNNGNDNSEAEYINNQQFLQAKLSTIWNVQFDIVKLLLLEKLTHEAMIKYLSQILIVNKTRGSLQPNESVASGEGLLTNVCAVLQKLVGPIKTERVNIDFPTKDMMNSDEWSLGKLLCEETRIFMDNESLRNRANTLKLIDENSSVQKPDFHTICFYLTSLAHNYGLLGSLRKQTRRASVIQSLQRAVDTASQNNMAGASAAATATINRYKSMLQHQKRASLCSEIVLSDTTYLRSAVEYYVQICQTISHCYEQAQSHQLSFESNNFIVDPTTETNPPDILAAVPQYLFEDMTDLLLHIQNKQPQILGYLVPNLHHLVSFILFVTTHSHYFKSPYLVAKFVELIFGLQPSVNNDPNLSSMFQMLLNHYTVTNGILTNKLIAFYIYVEKTGASSEFYDKFSIRFRISVIFRSLWTQPNSVLKMQLLTEAQHNREQFVKFINRAMNDMVYLLDESITALKRIRTNQDKRNDQQQWIKLTRQQRANIDHELAQDERVTRSQLTLADVTVHMLAEFTRDIPEPFLAPELVDKLASILNSLLVELVGPRCTDLKVAQPEKYNWQPKSLLQSLIKIYLNLDSHELIEAISNEQRYYSNTLFLTAVQKLTTYKIVSQHEAEHFDIIRQRIESLVLERERLDKELEEEDVPTEYLDPIMNNLMREPVMLPQSKIVMDKSVIKRHLLNDDCDPFNRQPLSLEDLIPQPELQLEIQNWLKQKQQHRKNPIINEKNEPQLQ